MFKELDTDKGGRVSTNEIEEFLNQRMGLGVTEQVIQNIMSQSDSNGDGQINFIEWIGSGII